MRSLEHEPASPLPDSGEPELMPIPTTDQQSTTNGRRAIFGGGLRLVRFLSSSFDATPRRSDSLGIPRGAGKGKPA